MERKRDIRPYVIFIFLSLLVGGIATLVSMDGMKAYAYLPQSPLTPPPVVFSIVWSVLYILMGVSAALVYTAPPRGLKDQHLLYGGTSLPRGRCSSTSSGPCSSSLSVCALRPSSPFW